MQKKSQTSSDLKQAGTTERSHTAGILHLIYDRISCGNGVNTNTIPQGPERKPVAQELFRCSACC